MSHLLNRLFGKKAAPLHINEVEQIIVGDDFCCPPQNGNAFISDRLAELQAIFSGVDLSIRHPKSCPPLTAHFYLGNQGVRVECFAEGELQLKGKVEFNLYESLMREYDRTVYNPRRNHIYEQALVNGLTRSFRKEGIVFKDSPALECAMTHMLETWMAEEYQDRDRKLRVTPKSREEAKQLVDNFFHP